MSGTATDHYTRFCVITNAHGIRGELKASSRTDTPEHYKTVKQVTIAYKDGTRENYPVTGIDYNPIGQKFLIRLTTVKDRNQAELLSGCHVLVHDSRLPPKKKGDILIHQLIGCNLIDINDKNYGTVTGYFENGAQGVLEVDYNQKEILIPLTDEIITEYCIQEKFIRFKPIDGLIDLNFK